MQLFKLKRVVKTRAFEHQLKASEIVFNIPFQISVLLLHENLDVKNHEQKGLLTRAKERPR